MRKLPPNNRRPIGRVIDGEWERVDDQPWQYDPARETVIEGRRLHYEDPPPVIQTPVRHSDDPAVNPGPGDVPRYRLIGWRDVVIAIVLTVLAVANWELWTIVLGS